ncbi:hypothetical protein HMPREF9134_01886 [Porphyromonas catoniae F0037]|uniref:Uncharacterized protein n=1 Tax=Porphyromonas catoniae F0037 TaxID=1127696 RepID=L1N9B8_9PORP|nr:hypothetical protein HMPREF9134_01886 [Porphyromonas catoniae F0037]
MIFPLIKPLHAIVASLNTAFYQSLNTTFEDTPSSVPVSSFLHE